MGGFPAEGEDDVAGSPGRRVADEKVAVPGEEALGAGARDGAVVPSVRLQVAAVPTQLPFQLFAVVP